VGFHLEEAPRWEDRHSVHQTCDAGLGLAVQIPVAILRVVFEVQNLHSASEEGVENSAVVQRRLLLPVVTLVANCPHFLKAVEEEALDSLNLMLIRLTVSEPAVQRMKESFHRKHR